MRSVQKYLDCLLNAELLKAQHSSSEKIVVILSLKGKQFMLCHFSLRITSIL